MTTALLTALASSASSPRLRTLAGKIIQEDSFGS